MSARPRDEFFAQASVALVGLDSSQHLVKTRTATRTIRFRATRRLDCPVSTQVFGFPGICNVHPNSAHVVVPFCVRPRARTREDPGAVGAGAFSGGFSLVVDGFLLRPGFERRKPGLHFGLFAEVFQGSELGVQG